MELPASETANRKPPTANLITGLLTANPMINKELRGRMRGPRSMIVMTIYLGLMALFCLLFYWLLDATAVARGPYDQQIGRDLLYAIVSFETLLVVFLAPAFTVSTISGERERQTFDLLMTTLLKPRSIVLGKMSAALALLLLLILAVAPLESLAFMFGGVAPEEIAGSIVVLLFAALLYGSIGFFWSCLMRSTVAATVLTYGTLLLILVGMPIVWFVVTGVLSIRAPSGGFTNSAPFIYLSGLLLSTNPLVAMGLSENFLRNGKPLFVFTDNTILNGQDLFIVQPWLVYCLVAILFSGLLLWWSSRLLPPVRRRHIALVPAGAEGGETVTPGAPPETAPIVGQAATPVTEPIAGYALPPDASPAADAAPGPPSVSPLSGGPVAPPDQGGS